MNSSISLSRNLCCQFLNRTFVRRSRLTTPYNQGAKSSRPIVQPVNQTQQVNKSKETIPNESQQLWPHINTCDVYDEQVFQGLKKAALDIDLNEHDDILNSISREETSNTKKENQKVNNEKNKRKKSSVMDNRNKKKAPAPPPPPSIQANGFQLSASQERDILVQLEIHLHLREFEKASQLFNFHRRRGHSYTVEVYNSMLHIWARQGNLKEAHGLVRVIRKLNIGPTYQTYAGLLEACGRSNLDTSDMIGSILSEIEEKGWSIQELFRTSFLTKEQLGFVRKALDISEEDYVADVERIKNSLVDEQLSQELKGAIPIKSIAQTENVPKRVSSRSALYQEIVDGWRKDFIKEMALVQSTDFSRKSEYQRGVTYGMVLTPEEIADILFDTVVPTLLSQPQGVSFIWITDKLGRQMYNKYCLKFQVKTGVAEKVKWMAEKYCSEVSPCIPRLHWEAIGCTALHLPREDMTPAPWSMKVRTQAASVAVETLMKVAKVDVSMFNKQTKSEIRPALVHKIMNMNEMDSKNIVKKYRKLGTIHFHSSVCRLYKAHMTSVNTMHFPVNTLPMVMRPKPWRLVTSGGYLLLPSDFIRFQDYKKDKFAQEGENEGKRGPEQVFDALSYLGNCAWRVHGRLLDIMIELFNGQGDMKLDIIGADYMKAEQSKLKQSLKAKIRTYEPLRKSYRELDGLRWELLYKLSVANHFRDRVFWVPNNMDFRGRVYPIAPHCSHIGNDVSRSMLIFAEGKPLGPRGLFWLKVHLVNVHGQLKKASLFDRVRYAEENIDDIMDSADNPLTGRKWWQDGDDPWQTLIACMEITEAIRSGDPESFVSHLPIQVDGSCNGLQHYAAMGRDTYGAKQVNLSPADRPQDVYSEAASIVEKRRQKDAEDGVEIAKSLEGLISRKVVKQTVMTVVYGVTFMGGRDQIENRLKELDIDKKTASKGAVYIVRQLFNSLEEMFTSARLIQDWLAKAASIIGHTGNVVEWNTPLDLHVIQPYFAPVNEVITTPLQKVTNKVTNDFSQKVDVRKQVGAFPPNFVHSLDSTHLMLTALRCQAEGMVFASVHDSFWTHGCDVDELSVLCREQFIHLHKQPILKDLKDYFDRNYSGLPFVAKSRKGESKFDELPEIGDFDIEEVSKSTYFFS